jgi:multidrug efflux pump subunit AcrA (membrane-fusion protein)
MRWKPVIFPLIVVGLGAGVGSWMMSNPASSLAYAEEVIEADPLADASTVATIRPVRDQYAPQLQLYSQLQSSQQVQVNSPAAADVLAVRVFEGDVVEQGDVLIELDTTSLQRQVAQLEARRMDLSARRMADRKQFESNQAALEVEQQLVAIAERSVTRLTNLRAQNLSSAADLENAERTLQTQLLSLQNRQLAVARYEQTDQQYQAQLIELDSQLDQAREQLADATITAPFAAKVSQVQVQTGASVVGGQSLLTLFDPAQQELVAWVAANAIENVPEITSLEGQLEAGNNLVPVQLAHADPSANAGSLRLFFETDNSVNGLILNRYYRMWVNMPVVQAYAVPESSVYSNRYVYLIEENQLQRTEVEVIGSRFEDGQIWRLVAGDLSGDVLVTRLENAAQGLLVREAEMMQKLAAAGAAQ